MIIDSKGGIIMEYLSESNVSIGLRMRQIRRAAHMTQEKLADTLGVSVNYLGEVERGRKPLSRSLADQFCQYFHVTYDYLYHGFPDHASNQIRERSNYRSAHHFLQDQIQSCSPEEIVMITRLVGTYLDVSRQLSQKNPQENYDHGQNHTDPELWSSDFP